MTAPSESWNTLEDLAEYFCATTSKRRTLLVRAMYDCQIAVAGDRTRADGKGFIICQGCMTGQVVFTWMHRAEAPAWAIERGQCKAGDNITQSVELCFTGRKHLSILLRVRRGHCYGYQDWSSVTMTKATEVLQDPGALL